MFAESDALYIFREVQDLEPGPDRDEVIGDWVWCFGDFRGQARPLLRAAVDRFLYQRGLLDPKSRSAWWRIGYVVLPGAMPVDRRQFDLGGRVVEFDVYSFDQVFEAPTE
jgi:hypothetical protein